MKSKRIACLLILSLTFATFHFQCKEEPDPVVSDTLEYGLTVDTLLYSPGLEGNLLGDSPDRRVLIYLPIGYEKDQTRRYPVVYFLHGFALGVGWYYDDINTSMNKKLRNEEIQPMIIVCPSSNNKYEGSWYTNSQVTGRWEDFMVQDVVQFTDNNYRTIASPGGRGIAGYLMGGYGAIKLAMKYPALFCAAFAMNPAPSGMEDVVLGTMFDYLKQAVQLEEDGYTDTWWMVRMVVSMAAAFSPNPNSLPFYCDFPLTESGTLIDSTWQKWLAHDLYSMLPAYKDSLLKLRAIQFDCGTSDALFYNATVHFSEALEDNGVEFDFTEYEGGYIDDIVGAIDVEMIPFFSEILDHE